MVSGVSSVFQVDFKGWIQECWPNIGICTCLKPILAKGYPTEMVAAFGIPPEDMKTYYILFIKSLLEQFESNPPRSIQSI